MDKVKEALVYLYGSISWPSMETVQARQTIEAEVASLEARVAAAEANLANAEANFDELALAKRGVDDRFAAAKALLRSVTCGDFEGIACASVNGVNWFDARDAALAQGADHAG